MAYDFEEQEKLDALKAWWAKYGTALLGVITVVMLAIAGYNGWGWMQRNEANSAMLHYEALEKAARERNVAQVGAAATTLQNDYASTGYAPRGGLLAAQAYLQSGDKAAARTQLQWVASKGKDEALAAIARLRLAGLLLDEKQYDEALAQLGTPSEAFAGLYADRRGDVLAAQGKTDDARAAYRDALAKLEQDDSVRPVVQLKLDALGGA